MTNAEMDGVLSELLAKYCRWSYDRLATKVKQGSCDHYDDVAPDGTEYQVEVQFFWDDKPGGNVRVMADLCAEPQRRLLWILPIYIPHGISCFIMSPDGHLVCE